MRRSPFNATCWRVVFATGVMLALSACGKPAPVAPPPVVQAWSTRLLGTPNERDAALVEIRNLKAAAVAVVLPLLDDAALAKSDCAALVREELVFILGESGEASLDAQTKLLALLDDPATGVGEGLAAARGLVVSWRICRDVSVLESYLALRERVRTADDVRKAQCVETLALTRCALPYHPSFLAVLRKGARQLSSAAFCLQCFEKYVDRQKELLGTYREIAQRLESESRADDPSIENERVALREQVGADIAAVVEAN